LAREYREIAHSLPAKALLGESLTLEEQASALDEFYHYIDLSNEQAFLRYQGRVTRSTWRNWSEGMRVLLQRPAFAVAWRHIKLKAPSSFQELRLLEASAFSADPRSWRRKRPALPPSNGV
jgi:hypothetical protein